MENLSMEQIMVVHYSIRKPFRKLAIRQARDSANTWKKVL